jgi:pyrroloquinoline-quinone synthase
MPDPIHQSFMSQKSLEIFDQTKIFENPYFQSLASGGMSKDVFCASQKQFFYAVEFYPRPMALLVARIPDGQKRLDILRNVLEEHGNLEAQHFHASTFKQFLTSLECQEKSFPDQGAAIRAFNSTLVSTCAFDPIEIPLACLGIIEFAFSKISGLIGKSVVSHKWVEPHNLIHYSTHKTLDIQHALEFFSLVEPEWSIPEKKKLACIGLNLGAYILDRLYRDLCDPI